MCSKCTAIPSLRSLHFNRSPPERDGREEGEGGVGLVGDAQVQAVVKEMAAKVKQVHINKFTALCVDLQKRQEWEDQGGEETAYDPLVRLEFVGRFYCMYIPLCSFLPCS